MIKSSGYDGVYTLMDTQTGMPVEVNAVYGNRHGDQVIIRGGRAPHKPGSTGRVFTRPIHGSPEFDYEYYPGVFELAWERDEEATISGLMGLDP